MLQYPQREHRVRIFTDSRRGAQVLEAGPHSSINFDKYCQYSKEIMGVQADAGENVLKSEKMMLALTAAFLCLLLAGGIAQRPAAGVTVEAQYQAAASAVAPVNGGKVDINTAPAAELAELPGIGEVLAQRIVEYREENGPFASIEDIQGVSGIGAGKFADMEAEITVGTAEGDG